MHDPDDPPRGASGQRRRWPITLIAGGLIAALIGLLIWRFPYAMEDQGNWARLIYLLLFLLFIAGGVFYRGVRLRQLVRNASIWLGIAAAIALGYAYRFELEDAKDRVFGELVPGVGVEKTPGSVRFRADASGHFIVEAVVNGGPVLFLVDTGASDVILSPRDAARIGIRPGPTDFTRRYSTANGTVMAAPITLDSIRIGPIAVRGVRASVNGAPLGKSLLGVSFLDRLTGYRVDNGTLVLTQ